MIRIVMADDHAIVRAGFRALLEDEPCFRIVAECDDARQALAAVQALQPDVLVLDLSLPGGGVAQITTFGERWPEMAILVLSMHDREPWISEAMACGARGYVSKGAAHRELPAALAAVAAGQLYLSSDLNVAASKPLLQQLTERERLVFLSLARGQAPKQIALEQGISDKTIYQHRSSLRRKLGVRTEFELQQKARELGLLE